MTNSFIGDLGQGTLLKILFTNGVYNQMSSNFKEWTMMQAMKAGPDFARQLQYELQTSLGPGAVQWTEPGNSGNDMPAAQRASLVEGIAKGKQIRATIQLEYDLYDRARKAIANGVYKNPLTIESDSKILSAKREIAKQFHGDGTGVIATLTAVDDTNIGSGYITVTVSSADAARGSVGCIEIDDLLLVKQADGSARAPTGGTLFAAYRVKSRNRAAGTADLYLVNSSWTAVTTYTASNIANTDVLYRYGQPDIPNLSSITDYGYETAVMTGIESLSANDGRKVNGITMSGSVAGSRYDHSTLPIDADAFQACLDQVKVNVGKDVYKWKVASASPETNRKLIAEREVDRRFNSVEDKVRGTKFWAYQHEDDVVEVSSSEYNHPSRIWMLPEGSIEGQKVLQFYGTDFEVVKGEGMSDFHLLPSGSASGGHKDLMVCYLQAYANLICNHPAAIGCIHNFT